MEAAYDCDECRTSGVAEGRIMEELQKNLDELHLTNAPRCRLARALVNRKAQQRAFDADRDRE